jgi:hypothetical protein
VNQALVDEALVAVNFMVICMCCNVEERLRQEDPMKYVLLTSVRSAREELWQTFMEKVVAHMMRGR